jgi:hypothetical protein
MPSYGEWDWRVQFTLSFVLTLGLILAVLFALGWARFGRAGIDQIVHGIKAAALLLCLAVLAVEVWYLYTWATHPQPGDETEHASEIAALCNADRACSTYKTTRFDCASAGNFEKCLVVRLGIEELPSGWASFFVDSLPGVCGPDGHLKDGLKDDLRRAAERDRWPTSAECLRVGAK